MSTKSYLNTLGVHRAIVAAFVGENPTSVTAELRAAADAIETLPRMLELTRVAAGAAQHSRRRLAYVARGDEAATAQFAALITKESSKVPAEGYVGGQFRHGPMELACDGLTAVIFGLRASDPDASMRWPLHAPTAPYQESSCTAARSRRRSEHMTTGRDASARQQTEVVVGIDIGGTGTRFVAWSTADGVVGRRTVATPIDFDRGTPANFLRRQIEQSSRTVT